MHSMNGFVCVCRCVTNLWAGATTRNDANNHLTLACSNSTSARRRAAETVLPRLISMILCSMQDLQTGQIRTMPTREGIVSVNSW
jgi:hypothetical protein